MAKKKKEIDSIDIESISYEIEGASVVSTNDFVKQKKVKKKRSGGYSKQKGSSYERQIVNELKKLTNSEEISTSRASSKTLDNMKIDINDENGILPCYFQLKKTQTTPSVKKINEEVGKIDKPLCIL